MNVFLSLLKIDLRRAFYSVNFIITIVFIMLVMFISSVGFMNQTSIDVISLIVAALTGSGSTLFILCIAPIFPYGISLAIDVENRTSSFWIIRTGTKAYASSKFTTAVIMGFLAVSISIFLYALLLSMFFPLFNQVTSGDSYAVLLESNKPYRYIVLYAIHYSLSAALFAGSAIAISTVILDKFSVIVIPIIVYFVLLRMAFMSTIPEYLNPSTLIMGVYPDVDPLSAILYKLIPITVILASILFVTIKQVSRRVRTT